MGMTQAIVDVIKQYPGWTMVCIVFLTWSVATGIENFLTHVGRKR
jgi:hypothetical protein